jgi:hypothetical protein
MVVEPYASARMVKMYVLQLDDSFFTEDVIDEYTLNEDRFTVDPALKKGIGISTPLTTPTDAIRVLSAKCSALAIMRAVYGANLPSKADYKDLKTEVEMFLTNLRSGETSL